MGLETMAKFYFHFRQSGELFPDEEGIEFSSFEDAYLSAFRAAQDMWRELLIERRDPRHCSFEVVDSNQQLMFVLPFMEILESCKKRSEPETKFVDVFRATLATFRDTQRANADLKNELRNANATLSESLTLLAQLRNLP